jgi:hypothetical protein
LVAEFGFEEAIDEFGVLAGIGIVDAVVGWDEWSA